MAKLFGFGRYCLQVTERNIVIHHESCLKHGLFSSSCRSYSVFPPYYVKPIFKPNLINEMEKTGDISKLAHVPILPARSEDTSSIFHDELVRRFTNYIVKGGKKELANDLLNKTFENIKRLQVKKYNSLPVEEQAKMTIKNPVNLLASAIENCKPILTLTPIKRGGIRYQVPVPVSGNKSQFLAIKWLLTAARDKERTVHLPEKLAEEILDAAENKGRVVKRKQDLHRQCEANRAYAHYRWS